MNVSRKIVGMVMAILMIVGISAGALVWYESNLVTEDATIESPLYIGYDEQLDISYGGSCEVVDGTIINNANNPISTVLAIAICAPEEYCEPVVEFAGCAIGGYYESEYVGYISFTLGEETIYLPVAPEPYNPCASTPICECMSDAFPEGTPENLCNGYYVFATTPVMTFDAKGEYVFEIDFVTHPEIFPGDYTIYMVCVSPEHLVNVVNIVHKNSSDWSTIDDPENGVLSYQLNENGILTYSYNNPLLDYELVVIMAETGGSGDWPQTGSMALIGTSGVADISAQLGCVNDGADYNGGEYGAKIWYVPTNYFDGDKFTKWTPGEMLFEEELIVDCVTACS